MIDDVIAAVRKNYVFADRGAAIAEELRARQAEGAYASLRDEELCLRLTADMQAVWADPHLRLWWLDSPRTDSDPADGERRYRERLRRQGRGVQRVAQLRSGPVTVGLIEFTAVGPPDLIGPAVASAFELVAEADALVLDLRANRGGTPEGAALICSYLLGEEPVHLNDVHDATTGTVQQMWSYGFLPGRRFAGPVWVLTSTRTFSAGEEVAYNLRALGRATLVGEVTRGGAHPSMELTLDQRVVLQVPHARSVNPITGTNWEGVGVEPHVRVAAADAEATALAAAGEITVG